MDTTHDIEASVLDHRRELVEPAAKLFAAQRLYGDRVRKQTKKAYGRLIDAHLLTTGVLGSALLRVQGKITRTDAANEERKALFASFVIGIKVCETAIEEGRYLQAAALLRQEMETLAQLKAVRAEKRNKKRSPNVAILERSLGRLYADLSAAAHVSRHHIVQAATEFEISGDDLPEPTSGTRYFPAFDEGLARRSFSLHLMLIINVIQEYGIDLQERNTDDAFTEREAEAIHLALQLMEAEGMAEAIE